MNLLTNVLPGAAVFDARTIPRADLPVARHREAVAAAGARQIGASPKRSRLSTMNSHTQPVSGGRAGRWSRMKNDVQLELRRSGSR